MESFSSYPFIECYTKERNPRTRIRLLALYHIQKGKSFVEIAEILQIARQTIGIWFNSFLRDGIEGLYDKPKSGCNTKLAREDELCFQQAVLDLQESRQGGRITATDILFLLKDRFHANYQLSGVYALLRRLDMVWITSRSQHPNHNEKAQQEFKKNSLQK